MRTILLSLVVLAAGCGGTKFDSPKEELRFLNDLSNPTAEQWKRRNALHEELVSKPAREAQRVAAEESIREATAYAQEREAVQKREQDKIEAIDRESRRSFLEQAKKWEDAGNRDQAAKTLQKLVKQWPNSPEAKTATIEILRLQGSKH